jgi:hypothetical protein
MRALAEPTPCCECRVGAKCVCGGRGARWPRLPRKPKTLSVVLLGCGRTCVTLLRWSADWDTACSLYEQAAAEFRRLGNKRKARLALEKAAYAQERLNS